ncbi:NADH-quinone oxidoreductase subunit N [Melghirimyces profundicolus]|uniref:NADH-quinone oxidoreductase subunit N n=1 Tax=Melghirimyces profundicolus TaxID=1242148 RepID=A0A2T6C2J4_9BACL|nr:NADH-quinone oxidoreductase subunit N [Melghirimyces profundicolus]PTX62528.1 NADH-quinone oxidoreductase subunit N [Melghirimyces profundicolus]
MEKYFLDYNWTVMAPELIILSAAALLSILDLLLKEEADRRVLGWIGILAVAAAGVFAGSAVGNPPYEILSETYRVDDFALVFKLILLAGTALVLLASLREIRLEGERAQGEYVYLLLTALLGGMILTSSADLITLFVGLELLSLSSYILAGIRRKRPDSNEAAWKYVVTGGMSSAFILYGMSFVYGLTGTTNLYMARQRLFEAYHEGYESFVLLSLFFMLLGFGFKVSSAPFHMWAPDVYQGSPTPVTAFLAAVSKTAAFAFVLRVLLATYLFLLQAGPWMELVAPALLTVSAASMVVGNTAALRQIRTKRMMAYSSVAHAGYLLVPVATAAGGMLFESTVYYLMAYLMMTLGAFTVLMMVERDAGVEDLAAFSGLSRRSPLAAAAMTVFLVSLAGIPVTAGFFGKFYILTHAVTARDFWIAAVMLVTTVISYYYYFGVIRMMYFRSPASPKKVPISPGATAVIVLTLVGTLLLGFFPQFALDFLERLDWTSVLHPAGGAAGN